MKHLNYIERGKYMKVLLVNKFHWLKGGSETYYFELGKLLKSHGHEVAYFSMEDERNIKTGDKEYFVKPSDMNSKDITKAFSVIYSNKNKKLMDKALDEFKPDIVHLNNFQRQLSASIITPCVKRHIPIVYTAHDVQAICPAITMMDPNGNNCELCMKGKYVNCFKKSCIKKSKLKSLLGTIESDYYRLNKIYNDKISYIITPSNFYKEKFIKDGYDSNKIKTLHNFIDVETFKVINEDNEYALYFGRLSKEKGVINLINAFSKLNHGKLYIAGTGDEEDKIKHIIKNKKLEKRIKLLGFLNKEQMIDAISKCKFVVVPSIWYENCPYSILETLAIGKPIIGSKMGGIPELICDKENGFIYKADDINELSEKMNILFTDNKLVEKFSIKSKELANKLYSKEKYYKSLIKIYEHLLKEEK